MSGEKSFESAELADVISRTADYLRDQGIDAYAMKESEVISSFDKEKAGTSLIVTDSGDISDRLLDLGFYVVGHRNSFSENEQFDRAKYVFCDIEDIDVDSFVKVYQRYAGEPWEILRTDRLLVRETTLEDVDIFYRLYEDPSMTRFMEGLFEDPEDEKRYQRDYIEKVYGLMGFGVWTLERLEDGAVIGRAGYSVRNGFDEAELGFLVGKEYQRQGYAFEACRAILDYGRDILGFDKVQTLVKEGNSVSIHMCQRLGFETEEVVEVEENIYGKTYREGQKVALSQVTYGKYVRMIRIF